MEHHELTAALLYLAQQRKAGNLTADNHRRLKTQLLSGDEVPPRDGAYSFVYRL